MDIATRLQSVRDRVRAACGQCGRDPDEVALLAVSKTRDATQVRDAMAAGQTAFGENRVQELVAKATEITGAKWHMIGSLQTNKVRALLDVGGLALLHSLDRQSLADELQVELARRDAQLKTLLQVNATGEDAKHGVSPADALALADYVDKHCPHISLVGVMAMGPLTGEPASTFAVAARVNRDLQDALQCPMPVLSLGMTDDLETAIAEGSTLVRIGTGIFGARPRPQP